MFNQNRPLKPLADTQTHTHTLPLIIQTKLTLLVISILISLSFIPLVIVATKVRAVAGEAPRGSLHGASLRQQVMALLPGGEKHLL